MQRRPASYGRPTGTDGSDFSYRMIVESRYTKVAQGKSRLRILLSLQMVSYILGCFWIFSTSSSKEEKQKLNTFALISNSVGFLSVLIGEIGRRRSQKALLRLYVTTSSIAVALSVACLGKSNLFFKVIQTHDVSSLEYYELAKAGRVVIGIVLQIIVIIATMTLVQNMSPKRTS